MPNNTVNMVSHSSESNFRATLSVEDKNTTKINRINEQENTITTSEGLDSEKSCKTNVNKVREEVKDIDHASVQNNTRESCCIMNDNDKMVTLIVEERNVKEDITNKNEDKNCLEVDSKNDVTESENSRENVKETFRYKEEECSVDVSKISLEEKEHVCCDKHSNVKQEATEEHKDQDYVCLCNGNEGNSGERDTHPPNKPDKSQIAEPESLTHPCHIIGSMTEPIYETNYQSLPVFRKKGFKPRGRSARSIKPEQEEKTEFFVDVPPTFGIAADGSIADIF